MLRLGVVALTLSCAALAGCSAATPADTDAPPDSGSEAVADEQEAEPVTITTSVRGRNVAVDQRVEVIASGGTLRKVAVTSPAGALPGKLTDNRTGWLASGRLEPGTSYAVKTVAERSDGERVVKKSSFSTEDLTLDEQTYASVAPLDGETVGIGMPVVVTFDVPVTDRASMERHMKVTSTPQQKGSWYWLSDTLAHWRPKSYWKAGSHVEVDLDINSVNAGGGIYGQENRQVQFDIGDAHVYKVNAQTHQMQVFNNGSLIRTIPITTGKAGFTTRSGTKVIMEKFLEKRMNSETVGISQNDPEYYDLDDVKYAMRVTNSGEFIHAAPWSEASQGSANVSHGCTGLSTENAAWLYNLTLRGDVVEYTGTDRWMTLDNGYGDWNLPFAEYRSGSALT
ncbi:L,D-transpeptidase [Nocardioides sp.]|uniref:L,D-transpeptidase n=1 Tax=Nocardioides sp. TaxID=35761 RepID=UPI002ED5ADCF